MRFAVEIGGDEVEFELSDDDVHREIKPSGGCVGHDFSCDVTAFAYIDNGRRGGVIEIDRRVENVPFASGRSAENTSKGVVVILGVAYRAPPGICKNK
jgi:hypothetical protein